MNTLGLDSKAQQSLLVFGATGSIGAAVCETAVIRGWQVTGVSRSGCEDVEGVKTICVDPAVPGFDWTPLKYGAPYSGVCWAQGANRSDSVYDVDIDRHIEIYQANVIYVLVTLKILLNERLLRPASRMCLISSIWQKLARQTKLSYCISKAALQGLVLSASADLAADGHLINAVLPGALDTPMTRRNLSSEQIQRLSSSTGFQKLPELKDVASVACFLCSEENTGITGQFIAVDLGFSHVRLV